MARLLLSFMVLAALLPSQVLGEESSNLSIQIQNQSLVPSELSLSPGKTVVWINRTENEVQVQFTSEAVSTTCKAPKRFVIDHRGIFISENIQAGGVASLCFLEKHDYPYEVSVYAPEGEASQKTLLYKLQGSVRVQ